MKIEVIDLTGDAGLAQLILEGKKKSQEIMNKNEEFSKTAKDVLGYPGRMICGSKSYYYNKYPKNFTVFNSNLVTAKGKIWYGDIDLTLDEEKVLELAKKIDQTVYVLREMDGRFENEENPRLDRAVYAASPDGKVVFENYYHRRAKGRGKGRLFTKEYE